MSSTNSRREFAYQLIRYVPDIVRNEFVNIGVILRDCLPQHEREQEIDLRFTRDWRRVRCFNQNADIALLKETEADLRGLMQGDRDGQAMEILDSFSLNLQVTEPKVYLAENLSSGLDELMRVYVD